MSLIYKGQTIAGVGGSGGSSEEIYSTEETRIGTWIDGKPLYRKVSPTADVVDGVNVLIPTSELPNIDIVTLSFATLVNINGANHNFITLPYLSVDQDGIVTAKGVVSYNMLRGLQIDIFNLSGLQVFGWIEYTKTTDEATS